MRIGGGGHVENPDLRQKASMRARFCAVKAAIGHNGHTLYACKNEERISHENRAGPD